MTDLRPDEQEVALAEAQAVLAVAADPGYRDELASLVAAAEEGALDEDEARTLERLLELGLQAGRIRAVYGPGGEQAALRLHRRLPGGAQAETSAREVTAALAALRGRVLDEVSVAVVGPGAFTVSLAADGLDLSVRLDACGARLASVGT